MRCLVKKSACMLLAALLIVACMSFVPMNVAKAVTYPYFDNPVDGFEYSVSGNGSSQVQVRIAPALVMVSGAPARHLFVKTSVNGRMINYQCITFTSPGTIKYWMDLDYFGQYTMECMVDIPEKINGVLYYHMAENDPSQFVAEASVSFTNVHKNHLEPEDPDEYVVDKQPTCTTAGSRSKHCTRCGEIIEETVEAIPATGHDWKIDYTWSSDYKSVTATAACKNDASHTVTETVKTTSRTSNGKTVFTAAFTKEPFSKQTKQVTGSGKPESYTAPDGSAYVIGLDGNATFKAPKKNSATVTIPDKVSVKGKQIPVTEISPKAFCKNNSLTTITIGKNIKTIGKSAFEGCAKLKTVKGGAGLVTIGANAFKGCKALTAFTVNKKVTSIGAKAFAKCAKLKSITIKSAKLTQGSFGKNSFKGIAKNAVVKCPKKQLADYETWMKKPGGAPKTAKWKK